MAIAVNEIIQEALELTSMVGDGEAAEGTLAASALGLLNRSVAELNNDSYFSATLETIDKNAGGLVCFRKLEQGEAPSPETIDLEPPESLEGVSRQIGNRFVPLVCSELQAMDRWINMALPAAYTYMVDDEVAPSGDHRLVGRLIVNGKGRCNLRIYMNRRLPKYGLYDQIMVSPLYHDAILYTLADKICSKYKLADYAKEMGRLMNVALAKIDRNRLRNQADAVGVNGMGSYDDAYYNGLAGDFSVG